MKFRHLQPVLSIAITFCVVGCTAPESAEHGKNHIILVGHGAPAKDYPKDRLRKFFHSHADPQAADRGTHNGSNATKRRALTEHEQLEREIREWPRTPENDPYKCGVEAMAKALRKQSDQDVIVAFNEYCAPTIEEAITQAVDDGAKRVVVLTTMITPGGGHSEVDIPEHIKRARQQHPDVEIVYAWPFEPDLIAEVMARQVQRIKS